MDRRVVPVVALLVLAPVAGCSSAGGTPTETPTTPSVAAPGVTHDGVSDPSRLADAHAASLRNRSYTLRFELEMSRDGGRRRIVRVFRVGPRHDRFSFVQRVPRHASDVWIRRVPFVGWSDGERTFVRAVASNETATSLSYRYAFQSEFLTAEEAIQLYFGGGNRTEVRRIERGGRIAYRIETTHTEAIDAVGGLTAVAVVDSFGLVREIRLAGPAGEFFWLPFDVRTRWDRVQVTVRYTAIGETTVERPGWVDEVNATTPTGT